MKFVGRPVREFALLAASLRTVVLTGCASLDQNIAKSKKEYIVPGKEIHVTDMNNYPFCEIGLITGTSMSNAVANIWNSTGVSDCPPDKIAAIEADQGARIQKATGARKVWINPRRHWTFNEFWVYEVGAPRDFEGVMASWMGVLGVEPLEAATVKGDYSPGLIYRHNKFLFKAGATVYLLDASDGKGVFVMQSWTDHFNKGETAENLKDLGSQFKHLPPGWKWRVKVIDRDLSIAPPPPGRLAHVMQDEFRNTYQGCGYDAACTYTP
jgi:hypothetical protein